MTITPAMDATTAMTDAPDSDFRPSPGTALRLGRHRPARSDALWVLAGTLLTFLLASAFQWQERLAAATARFERWQVDELPSTLVALSLGLAWYAARRRSDAARLLAHNRELAQRLIEVQERERRALARELHDELAQHCTAIRVEAAYLRRAVDALQIAAAAQRTADTAELLQRSVGRLLRRLRPAELDELGLVAALQSMCADWEKRSGVRCELQVEGTTGPWDAQIEIGVYRVAQEACTNVQRHARATRVRVGMTSSPSGLTLNVDDDGCGFDASVFSRGLGLLGASERAAALGGRLDVDSSPGAGTRLAMSLPLRPLTAAR